MIACKSRARAAGECLAVAMGSRSCCRRTRVRAPRLTECARCISEGGMPERLTNEDISPPLALRHTPVCRMDATIDVWLPRRCTCTDTTRASQHQNAVRSGTNGDRSGFLQACPWTVDYSIIDSVKERTPLHFSIPKTLSHWVWTSGVAGPSKYRFS